MMKLQNQIMGRHRKAVCLMGVLSILLSMISCTEEIISDDPTLRLSFSHDSVCFDTVFTDMGSSTKRMLVYNPNKNAIKIQQVRMQDGQYFRINVDGENEMDNLRNLTLQGGDSVFIFIRTDIDIQHSNAPVLIEDSIVFMVNGHQQHVYLQAYGQDVEILRNEEKLMVYDRLILNKQKPYLIYDTIVVQGLLSIQEGTTLYMHQGAMIYAYGTVYANGTLEEPIVIRGDRTDRLFDSVPYRVASGQWGGLYLVHQNGTPRPTHHLKHIEILSGTVGLYVISESTTHLPTLSLQNARIHNHSEYGLVLQNVDATVVNTEISNCASYCVYLAGGKHYFVHNTIASYFGFPYTTINIHSNKTREDVAAVYINNLSKSMAPTETSFYNCIISGARKNNVVVATPLPTYYSGKFVGNYLQCDSLSVDYAKNNVYASDSDTVVFRNVHYLLKEYRYYDFQLDSISPARGVADSTIALSYPYDRLGHRRKIKPDAGCYEFIDENKE